jgi:TRAP-type C4-dicarboxylate transport system permease small subunit
LNKVKRVIQLLGSLLDRVTSSLWLVGGALIVLMAIDVGYGVVMRYIFRNPSSYAFEIACMSMLGCTLFSIAHTQRLGRHLRVDIMDRYLPEAVKGILLNIVSPIVGLIFCIPFVWESWNRALFALHGGQVTSTLGIPTFPMMMVIPIGVGLLCLVLIAQILRYLASLKGKDTTTKK